MGARGTRNVKRQYAGGGTELLGALFEQYNALSAYKLRDGVVGGGCGLQAVVGALPTLETTRPVRIRLNGEEYVVPITTGITVAADTIADNLWLAFFLTADETGAITVTTTEIGGAGTGASELGALLAILSESDSQLPTDEVLIGVVTLQGDSTGWTGATDDFAVADALTQAVNFYDILDSYNGIVTPAATFAQSATTDEMDLAAVVAKMNGKRVTLAADANFPFSLADTINTGAAAYTTWGGWLVVQDASGNIFTLNADGTSIGVSDMAFAQKAEVEALLDALEVLIDAIPLLAVVSRLYIQATASDVFTANTELLNVGDAAVADIDFEITATDDEDFDPAVTGGTKHLKPPVSLVNL